MPKNDFAKNIKKQFDEYFAQKRKIFDIKISFNGTDFQNKVYNELLKIPYGKTKTYKGIANLIDNSNAQRAVGGVCNKNPILIIIPWPQGYRTKRQPNRLCLRN